MVSRRASSAEKPRSRKSDSGVLTGGCLSAFEADGKLAVTRRSFREVGTTRLLAFLLEAVEDMDFGCNRRFRTANNYMPLAEVTDPLKTCTIP